MTPITNAAIKNMKTFRGCFIGIGDSLGCSLSCADLEIKLLPQLGQKLSSLETVFIQFGHSFCLVDITSSATVLDSSASSKKGTDMGLP